jgi:hypothetical protein
VMELIDGSGMSEEHTSLILCGCWASWKERNARKHGEGGRSITDSVRWVMQTTIDLARVGSGNLKRPPKNKDHWKAPDEGVIKINTDASFLEATMSGAPVWLFVTTGAVWLEDKLSGMGMLLVLLLWRQGLSLMVQDWPWRETITR